MRKRPNASRAVSLVRQNGLDRTVPIRSFSRRAPRPMTRASARPCALRFRCVRQSESTTGSWSGFEKSVAACRKTSTSPPCCSALASAGSAFWEAPAAQVGMPATTIAAKTTATRPSDIPKMMTPRTHTAPRRFRRTIRRGMANGRTPTGALGRTAGTWIAFAAASAALAAPGIARSQGAPEATEGPVVVIELDTAIDMVGDIFGSRVPVVSYVAPEGAQAASAGTFVASAAALVAMAPATNIGAASVVGAGGEDLPETLSRKATEDAAALIRSIAKRRDRPVAPLEATVREAASYSAVEALELGIADLITADLEGLVARLEGRVLSAADGDVLVRTVGAEIHT